jgi:hypothetical protein
MKTCPNQSAVPVTTPVLVVLAACYDSYVYDSVIGSYAIDVVDLTIGPVTVH